MIKGGIRMSGQHNSQWKNIYKFLAEYMTPNNSYRAGNLYESFLAQQPIGIFEDPVVRRKDFEMCLRYEVAKENGFPWFATTLTLSPYKNAEWLNEIGETVGGRYAVNYLYTDFKKKGGYYRSTELSKEYNLYRQDFCGCKFSKR